MEMKKSATVLANGMEILNKPIDFEDLSVRMQRVLKTLKVETWEDLASKTERDFAKNRHVSQVFFSELRDILIDQNLYLTPTRGQEELINEYKVLGIPFGKDELRMYLGYTKSEKFRNRIYRQFSLYPEFKDALVMSLDK